MNGRLLCLIAGEFTDADTGEIVSLVDAMENPAGGVIGGYGLYPYLADTWPRLRGKWNFSQPGRKGQERIRRNEFYRAHKKLPKIATGKRHIAGDNSRPRGFSWVFLNLEKFHNEPDEDVPVAVRRVRKLCEDRGIKITATPGGMGKSGLMASSEWEKLRYFAPPWISEIAREHLPGNHYAHREGFRRDKGILLIDQQAAHHNIVNSIPLPDPSSIRRRGRRTPGKDGRWIKNTQTLWRHMGLLHAMVEVQTIPRYELHLYPKWAQKPGTRLEWVWTPELRLLDNKVRLIGVQTALTGSRLDAALLEYSDFALDQIHTDPHPVIKPILHAAYGSLAVDRYKDYKQIILGDIGDYKDTREVKLALIDEPAHEVTIKGMKISPVQNVVAYGVICAEQTVRSLELARVYEREHKLRVIQVYADALLVRTNQVPITPAGWEVKTDLGEVVAGAPNQIISARLQRIPGLSGERRRAMYVHQVMSGTAHAT